ncbi:helix-turn-helix transcriptional regulator [Chryseolinea sp. H1M3-3]|uniref:helix-turn-helix domain-containing protein n=1 Tax=Chryseolinea sp. H1M3-3 TaxID=3034144 RepID=UPI0023EB10FD|nr:helix-turn-helix transcriptional regulator [Chryseolinea sp. H1M3-3]
MKQPALGRKITELRKAKGLTQEDLVEKCNISVRTIQRIEAGEVVPRSYTVKTILTALDYDLDQISFDDNTSAKSGSNWLRDLILIDVDLNKSSDFLLRQLNIAWVFGVIYFILGFLEGPVEYLRLVEKEMILSDTVYVVLKTFIIISFLFFQRGIIIIAGIFENYLLKIITVILIGAYVLIIGYDIVSTFYDSLEGELIVLAASVSLGGIGIIYGVALRRLDKSLGRVAELAGIFEIVAACFFLTIILSFIGLIIQVPAVLLEIIVIFKAIDVIKSKQPDGSLAM